jgi:hypothetical protein
LSISLTAARLAALIPPVLAPGTKSAHFLDAQVVKETKNINGDIMSSEKNLTEPATEFIWKHRGGLDAQPASASRNSLEKVPEKHLVAVFPVVAVVENLAHGIRELTSPLSDG